MDFLHGKILRGIQEFLTTIKHVALALNSRSSSYKERPKSCSIYDLSINNQLFCPTQFILIFVVLKHNKNQGFFNVRSFLLELHIAPLHLNKIHRKQNPTQFICKKFVICIEQVLINWQLWKKSHHDIINQIIMVSTVETYYLFSLSSHKRSLLSYRELNIDNNVFAEPRLHNSSSPGEPECKNILMGSSFYGAPPPPSWLEKG